MERTAYYYGVFSHRKPSLLWKGMLHVDLTSIAGDDAARALADFLNVVDAAGGTLDLSTGSGRQRCALDTPETTHATAERARRARLIEEERSVHGVLLGVLPLARRFEFQLEPGGEVIEGRVTEEIEDAEALAALVRVRCVAALSVVTLERAGKEQRAYYLKGIAGEADAP